MSSVSTLQNVPLNYIEADCRTNLKCSLVYAGHPEPRQGLNSYSFECSMKAVWHCGLRALYMGDSMNLKLTLKFMQCPVVQGHITYIK